MVSFPRQIVGFSLAVIGFLGSIVTCALPIWKVKAVLSSCDFSPMKDFWEGLWMYCVRYTNTQCKVYDSMQDVPQDLQAARVLVVISILLVLFGILLSVVGAKCTNCIEDEAAKNKVAVVAGVIFIVGGILCLIPVSWSAYTIIRDFNDPLVIDAQRRELGASLFIGWAAAGLLLIGGLLLCCQRPPCKDTRYTAKYSAPRSAASAGDCV